MVRYVIQRYKPTYILMKLLQRIAFYSGGFIVGLIILFFFLGGKRASCDYGPEARTLKNIRSKPRIISPDAMASFKEHDVDTSVVSEILVSGEVLFSESETDRDSCNIYVIKSHQKSEVIKLYFENCEDEAKLFKITPGDN